MNQVSQALFFLATGQQSILMNIRGLLCLQLLTTIFSIVLRSISHKLYVIFVYSITVLTLSVKLTYFIFYAQLFRLIFKKSIHKFLS